MARPDAEPDEGFGQHCIGHVTPVGQSNGSHWRRFTSQRLLGVFSVLEPMTGSSGLISSVEKDSICAWCLASLYAFSCLIA
jgi:hypothetical protein